MKSLRKVVLKSSLLVYFAGVMLSPAIFLMQDRMACYEKSGFIGSFWCPEVVAKGQYSAMFVDAVVWPVTLVLWSTAEAPASAQKTSNTQQVAPSPRPTPARAVHRDRTHAKVTRTASGKPSREAASSSR